MKKIILLTALLSVGGLNAEKIWKAEPVEPVKVVTLKDVEIQQIKTKIKNHNKEQQESIVKYEDISYNKEKDMFKISNVKLYDKKGELKIPIRIGDVWVSSLDDARNMKLIMNNIRITKEEIIEIQKSTGEEITADSQQQIDSVFMLADTEELVIKLNTISNAVEAEQTMVFDQLVEIENFGRMAFIIKASEVDKSLFAKDLDPQDLTKEQKDRVFEIKISDFELNVETLFSLGKLRAMIDSENYKEIINKQIADLVKDENKQTFEKNIELKVLEAIRDNKNVIVKMGIGKDFTIMEGVQAFMMAMMNPQMSMDAFEVYITAENK